MEKEKKKLEFKKYIAPIIGSFFILLGVLLTLIPVIITPNYRLVKGSVDLTDEYILDSEITLEEYGYYYLDDLNTNLTGTFNNSTNDIDIEIDLASVYNENNDIYIDKNAMIEIYFAISILNYDELIHNELYEIISYPSILFSCGTNKFSYTFTSISYIEIGKIYLDKDCKDNLIIESKSDLIVSYNNEEIKSDYCFSGLYFYFFKES